MIKTLYRCRKPSQEGSGFSFMPGVMLLMRAFHHTVPSAEEGLWRSSSPCRHGYACSEGNGWRFRRLCASRTWKTLLLLSPKRVLAVYKIFKNVTSDNYIKTCLNVKAAWKRTKQLSFQHSLGEVNYCSPLDPG